jgi:hypothetical protein
MDASRYPDKEYQLEWIRIYLEEWNKHNKITSLVTEDDVYQLFSQVSKFALVCKTACIHIRSNLQNGLGSL